MTESFLSKILAHIRSHPEAPALVSDGTVVSFGALGRHVRAVLDMLETDATSGLVMIQGHKEPGVVAAMLACMCAGRGFVFVDRSNPPDRLARIQRVADARTLFHANEAPEVHADVTLHRIPPAADQALGETAAQDWDPADLLYVIFTSGSTGEPKGVPISHANFAAFHDWYGPMLQDIPGRTLAPWQSAHVNHASLAFDMGMLDLWPVLALGRPVVLLDHRNNIMPHKNIEALIAHPDQVAVRSWFSTPSLLQLMCTDPRFNANTLPGLQCFFVGGEAVQHRLVKDLKHRFPQADIRHAYGPSEGTCMSHVHRLSDAEIDRGGILPLGPALAENVMRIVDADGTDVPEGTPGEVELTGPQIVTGYLPADHPGNAAFSRHKGERSYRTGDLGYVDAAGNLILLGRADRQVKWNGNRIELDEIERAAHSLAQVQKAACLPVREAGQLRDIILFVQPECGHSLAATDCAQALSALLPQTMIPRDIRVRDSLPVTVNGKVDSRALLTEATSKISAKL
jgi:D-alanine--poly(phosphoribitol) ligase subunit 1